MESGRRLRGRNDKALAIRGNCGGALGPMGADDAEPLIDFTSKEAVFRVNTTAQLLSQSAWRE